MKNHLLLGFCLVVCQTFYGQNQIQGNVLDQQSEAVFLATVAIYDTEDSSLVKAASTDEDGHFEIKNIKDGNFYLEISMLSYETYRDQDLRLPQDFGKNYEITLVSAAELLQTVEVTAKVPLIEQRADRLVVNVENNLTNLNANLMDVLKKVPGMVIANGRLRMAGQPNITILINGKTTRYMNVQELLRDMPGENVKKVEVIHQPGAEFDAAGTGAIINIILKKNSLFGTNGSFNAGIGKDVDWTYNAGLNLSHAQGDVNISGGIGYTDNAYLSELLLTRRLGSDIYDQHSIDPQYPNTFRSNLTIDWDITERHRVGVSGNLNRSNGVRTATNTTLIDFAASDASDLNLRTATDGNRKWNYYMVNPYYTFQIDTFGHKIDLDLSVVNLSRDGTNTLRPKELNFGNFFPGQEYRQPGIVDIKAAKVDYQYPVSNAITLQLGAKYSEANLDNELAAFLEISDGDWQPNPNQSNHFLFDETITAGYSKLAFQKDKWSGSLGLRYEDSRSKGHSLTLDSTLTRNISQFFPSFSLSRELTKSLGTSLAYSYRIDRPQYSTLNPFVYNLDPFTAERGNPNLVPSLTHSFKFNLTYEKQPFFNVEYKQSTNSLIEVTEQNDDTGEAFLTTINLESQKLFNVSLFFPLDFIPGISGYGGIMANHVKYESEYLSEDFRASQWSYTAFLQANFKLPLKIEAEMTGFFMSDHQEGIMRGEWLYGIGVGLSRKFLEDKARISFGVDDLFNRFWHGSINYANMDMQVISKWYAQRINLKFSYKFGNQHMNKREGRRSGASDEVKRVDKS